MIDAEKALRKVIDDEAARVATDAHALKDKQEAEALAV